MAPSRRAAQSEEPVSTSTDNLSSERKLFGQVSVPGFVITATVWVLQSLALVWAIWNAFRIRTYALVEYGFVIHEFDPWFNFRATQYLSKHTLDEFFKWYDYMSWYPLGRPVGTTIYPGLQITSVAIHRLLKRIGWKMSLNNVCCYVPCWGGACATFFMYLLTAEATGSRTAGVIAAIIMGVIPAHMMRSVGGGYDNESIAMTALVMTFYFWIRSLRSTNSWPIGIIAGLSYAYMVAAWGGYVFVINMLALHAAVVSIMDMFRNRYTARVWKSYSLMYVIGTSIAIQIPVVGMTPFKSLEQLFALLVFVCLQVLHVSEILRKKADVEILSKEGVRIRVKCFLGFFAGLIGVCMILAPTGYFGPLSSRVRGLFVQHTRTGNPLVDSVAEHQPATPDAYWHYMHYCCVGWQLGIVLLPFRTKRWYAGSFLVLYSIVAYYFSLRMARLIILASPVASGMSGFCLDQLLQWCFGQIWWSDADADLEAKAAEGKDKKGKKVKIDDAHTFEGMRNNLKLAYTGNRKSRVIAASVIIAILVYGKHWRDFNTHAEHMAHSFANPQLMFKSRLNNGEVVMIDDYREAYFWLRDKTPKDSRVMAWWDYGYQITGIGERTSIADGNTWNHEHIATLGYCLTSPVKRAHELIRHLADYVLVWSGGGGDDLAKSPHMARIGNSVYRDICPKDPLCTKFGFRGANHEDPTPMMRQSLLYNLHAHNMKPGVRVDPKLFKEAYTSKYGLVRIFKVMNVSEESKAWNADPANRQCDAPGSWYCTGQYPPAEPIQALLKKRRDFGQLEDFNKGSGDEEYTRQYMARMSGRG